MAANQPAPARPLLALTPGPAFQESFQLVFQVTNQAIQAPSFRVQAGMSVIIKPINGSIVNLAPCFLSDRRSLIGTNAQVTLPAGSDVAIGWDCQNTGQIYAAGLAGDGILIVVSQPAFA